ncbi:MAG TPA: dienelactone hydrolase family protein [Methylomirabilota bacterium]|jgi:carboxymethylenebutenolidase|nr:dienelactone hydrolase family protein [Methylomirabilota bacterium]
MGEMINLTAEDGFKLDAYKATPKGTPRGALVVIQEIFGVNHHIKNVTDGFAADGYVALAPAIFDRVERGFETGYQQADIERGRAVRGKLTIEDAVKDVRAAVKELQKTGLKVGVVGYCFGGTLAWLAATRIDGIAAAVSYYGGGVADAAEEKPKCPVIFHWGETDASIPKEHWDKVRKNHPNLTQYVYPAGHGFQCDERASYHEPSARQARERTIPFFRQHVG